MLEIAEQFICKLSLGLQTETNGTTANSLDQDQNLHKLQSDHWITLKDSLEKDLG